MNFSRSTWTLVALNVAWLAVATFFLARVWREEPAPARIEYVTNHVPVAAFAPRPATATNTPSPADDFRWAQLESEDYRTYIQRLRSIGCPEQTIRDIIIADVDKLLAPRMQAAGLQPRDLKYWQPVESELWSDESHREALRKQRALDFEKREVIRELLGVDLVGERLKLQGQNDYYGARLSFLPEEKRAQVRLVLDRYADEERALLEEQIESEESVLPADELAQLQRQRQSEVAQLLSPAELEQYELWFSPVAERVRDAVFGMEATEEEFLAIYELHREFGASGLENGPAGEQELQARIRARLGEERYEEFARSQDPGFRDLYAITTRFNLPRAAALELYGYKRVVEEQRAEVDADSTLAPEQKSAAQQAITEETQRAFREALGEKAFKQYVRRPGSRWLR